MHEIAAHGLRTDLTLVHARILDFGVSDFEHPFLWIITMNRLIRERAKF